MESVSGDLGEFMAGYGQFVGEASPCRGARLRAGFSRVNNGAECNAAVDESIEPGTCWCLCP